MNTKKPVLGAEEEALNFLYFSCRKIQGTAEEHEKAAISSKILKDFIMKHKGIGPDGTIKPKGSSQPPPPTPWEEKDGD